LFRIASCRSGYRHQQEASQQIGPAKKRAIKEEAGGERAVKEETVDKVACRLQAIYRPDAIARSQEQAVALAFIYTAPCTSIVVLPTGSSKSVLFFSVAAVAIEQTVVVVVLFSALVDDIVEQGRVAGR
jgi:superfamily II DNA helicase RecQ